MGFNVGGMFGGGGSFGGIGDARRSALGNLSESIGKSSQTENIMQQNSGSTQQSEIASNGLAGLATTQPQAGVMQSGGFGSRIMEDIRANMAARNTSNPLARQMSPLNDEDASNNANGTQQTMGGPKLI